MIANALGWGLFDLIFVGGFTLAGIAAVWVMANPRLGGRITPVAAGMATRQMILIAAVAYVLLFVLGMSLGSR